MILTASQLPRRPWVTLQWRDVPAGFDHIELYTGGRHTQTVRGYGITDTMSRVWPGRSYIFTAVAQDINGHELARASAPLTVPWPEPLTGDFPALGLLIDHPDAAAGDAIPGQPGTPLTEDLWLAMLTAESVVWQGAARVGLAPWLALNSGGLLRLQVIVRRIALEAPSTAYPNTEAGLTALMAAAAAKLPDVDLASLRLVVMAAGGRQNGAGGPSLPGAAPGAITAVRDMSAVRHEVGHVLGLLHAADLPGIPTDLLSLTNVNIWADVYDHMGNGLGHYGMLHKLWLGWCRSDQVVETDTPGDYQLDANEDAAGDTRLLIIPLDEYGSGYAVERVTETAVNGGQSPGFVVRLRPAFAPSSVDTCLLTGRRSGSGYANPLDPQHPFVDVARNIRLDVVAPDIIRLGPATVPLPNPPPLPPPPPPDPPPVTEPPTITGLSISAGSTFATFVVETSDVASVVVDYGLSTLILEIGPSAPGTKATLMAKRLKHHTQYRYKVRARGKNGEAIAEGTFQTRK